MTTGEIQRVEGSAGLGARLMRVAWLAIVLGLGVEVLLLVVAVFGDLGTGTFVADLVKSVSWSVFVCVGIAVGTAITKARVPLMGLLGLLAAPAAFEASRALHKGTVEALALSGATDAGGTPTVLLAVIKGVEYGCLGVLVGWVGNRAWGGAAAHIGAGLAVGIVFGGFVIGLVYGFDPGAFSAADFMSRAVNELLFPVGCALVLYSATTLAARSNQSNAPSSPAER